MVNKAVILAGGLGSRFGDVTQDLPKGLVMLNGKPLLEHVIDRIHEAGVFQIGIVIGHKGEMIKEYFGDGSRFGIKITYADQEKIDGVRSALLAIENWVAEDDFLMACCDILTDTPLLELISSHEKGRGATVGVTRSETETNKAIVVCDEQREVKGIYAHSDEHTSWFIDAAFLIFTSNLFTHLRACDNYIDGLNSLIFHQGASAVEMPGAWYNINSNEDLARAELHLQKKVVEEVDRSFSQSSVII